MEIPLVQEQQTSIMTMAAPPRRPRVREVSSRFMSPVVSSSSSGDLHLSTSKCPLPKHVISTSTEFQSRQQQQRSQSVQRQHPELEPLCCTDENRVEAMRSSETPFGSQSKLLVSVQRKQQRAVNLFKENGCSVDQQQQQQHSKTFNNSKVPGRSRSRTTDTPGPGTVYLVDKMSTPRSVFSSSTQSFQRSINIGSVASVVTTAAAKLVQSNGNEVADDDNTTTSGQSNSSEIETSTILLNQQGGGIFKCSSPPIPGQNCKMRSLPDFRSSMPEADFSERIYSRGSNVMGDSSKVSASPCYRSLNSPLSSTCENSLPSPAKSVYKSSSALSKPFQTSMKSSAICLPPHPSNPKFGTEAKKGRKVSNHLEDVHTLRLLHNRYLQWRYANAKAESVVHAQRIASERSLHALGEKISELHNSVKRKRIELGQLKETAAISTILEAQMPYLDEWSALEGDYSSSLSGALKSLQDASLRLPIIGNVRADIREIGEALCSASTLTEIMYSHVGSFLPKAEEMDTLISELAGLVSGERALIEECGDLLSKTHMLQLEECSLRAQLIQLKPSSSGQTKKT